MALLSDYLTQTRQLLRDETASVYTDVDLTSFINRGIQQRDLELGLNRVRVSFPMTASTFSYSIATILTSGTVLTGGGQVVNGVTVKPTVIDVLSIMVTPLGQAPGGIRYPLGRWPYSRLAYLLSTSYPTYPVRYALYGTGTIMVGPPPAGNYATEWDLLAYSAALTVAADVDPLGYPWTDPIPFLAAHFAKLQTQRFDEAKEFLEVYRQRLTMVQARGRAIAVANPLFDLPRR